MLRAPLLTACLAVLALELVLGVANVLLWERIILPVPVGPNGAILVCYSEVMSHQAEIYEYVFMHSPIPMLTIYPIFAPDGALDDGWIVLINQLAGTIRAPTPLRMPIAAY